MSSTRPYACEKVFLLRSPDQGHNFLPVFISRQATETQAHVIEVWQRILEHKFLIKSKGNVKSSVEKKKIFFYLNWESTNSLYNSLFFLSISQIDRSKKKTNYKMFASLSHFLKYSMRNLSARRETRFSASLVHVRKKLHSTTERSIFLGKPFGA